MFLKKLNNIIKKFLIFFAFFFASCSVRLKFSEDESGILRFWCSLDFPNSIFSDFSGEEGDFSFLDWAKDFFPKEELQEIFLQLGIENAEIQFSEGSVFLEGNVAHNSSTKSIKSLFLKGNVTHNFKEQFLSKSGIDFLRDFLCALYDASKENFQPYFDLLCAPIFTGENFTREEYFSILSSLYGEKIAGEILFSKIEITHYKKNAKTQSEKYLVQEILCR